MLSSWPNVTGQSGTGHVSSWSIDLQLHQGKVAPSVLYDNMTGNLLCILEFLCRIVCPLSTVVESNTCCVHVVVMVILFIRGKVERKWGIKAVVRREAGTGLCFGLTRKQRFPAKRECIRPIGCCSTHVHVNGSCGSPRSETLTCELTLRNS